jgi:iron complex transport system substrate-binding protein
MKSFSCSPYLLPRCSRFARQGRGDRCIDHPVWIAGLCALLLACCACGCRDRAGEAAMESRAAAPHRVLATRDPAATDFKITVTDRLDRQVSFTAAPQRIVSLTPSMTEVLFGIAAGDRLVGATTHCNYPPAAEEVPRVGGGTLESINQEKIVALNPDLVLCKWDKYEPLLRNLERLGVPVLALGPETLAELYDETRMLGQVTGNSTQAETLVESMQQRVATVVRRVPAEGGPKVFFQVWNDPLMSAGRDSFIGELLSLAGLQNLFDETPIRYPKVNPEVVVAGDPDVILAPSMHAAPVTIESILTRPGWSRVRAIREKRIYLLNRDTISRCGPRLVDALEEIVAVVYPERFASPAVEVEAGEQSKREDHAL